MKFPQRELEKIVKKICLKNKINFNSLSQGFVLELSKKNKTEYIYGYNFPCNSVTSSKICDDKSAISEILSLKKIPNIEHVFFMNDFFTQDEVIKTFKKFKNNVVVKPNNGTGGKDVYHCTTTKDLTIAIDKVLSHSINFTISPFYNYQNEYRLIMYNNKCYISYKKERGGDWRHNLALGATPNESIEKNILKKLIELAISVIKVIKINFCSVDIAEINNNTFKIIEINSGVMMEKYSLTNYEKTYKLYELVITNLFSL
ncbi:MAG: hypothetical protein Ta2E_07760 [Mycoplasmoidaceae bacterium]|nr:MAG: hypothetical protein Ta2E_07760 [Mycoplasmoidaceae bacterium]